VPIAVFGDGPRKNGDRHRGFSGWSKAKVALDQRIVETRRLADPEAQPLPWRLHDLRRTCATVMADRLGVTPYIVEAVLNHVSGHKAGVAGVYNRATYEAEMRIALQSWAKHLASITQSENIFQQIR
jgi:integrase